MRESASKLPAGSFGAWLRATTDAAAGDGTVDVPCGDCVACCTSSQFVHIGPDERATLARIPDHVVFPAPGAPPGWVVLGYDERGHCPMFVDGGCSIYDVRPRTCRSYDCRVFPASGLAPATDKPGIVARAASWRFEHVTDDDAVAHRAVQDAAAFLSSNPACFPDGSVPTNPGVVARLAVDVHDEFLAEGPPDPAVVEARLAAR